MDTPQQPLPSAQHPVYRPSSFSDELRPAAVAEPESTDDDTLRYWLALQLAPGVGAITFQRILELAPDLSSFFSTKGECCDGQISMSSKLRRYLRHPDWKAVDTSLEWAQADDCHILSLFDPLYPALLKEIPDPPPLLFVRGDERYLGLPQLAMVGSRNPSAGGKQLAHDFAASLSRHGLIITSGLALGIDAASHQGALDTGGKTIAVAGTGLDRIYHARHRELGHHIIEQGALISEFPPGPPAIAHNFPRRNRIISGLSLGTLVVEAALKSGSLITARLAAEQNREVFAIPGSIHNPLAKGCHALIQTGAKLTTEVNDILEELDPLAHFVYAHTAVQTTTHAEPEPNTAPPPFNDYPLLESMGFEPISIDELVERSGLTAEAVSAMLLTMELQGIVTSRGGMYSRTN